MNPNGEHLEGSASGMLPVDECPAHPEMIEAWRQSKVRYLPTEWGGEVPVRVFGERAPRTPVILLHGLQSHSGWFVQSGQYLADMGHPVYAFDRRGSGLSREPRGHAARYEEMLGDLGRVVEYAIQDRSSPRVHLLGHCFGAIPAALFARQESQRVKSLILASPGLYTQVAVPALTSLRILWSRWTGTAIQVPVPYTVEHLTDQESYQRFIRADRLALSALTSDFFYEVFRARRSLISRARRLTMPVLMALAGNDALADNGKNRAFYQRTVSVQHSRIVTYGHARHIIEFSTERGAFLRDLGDWLLRIDRGEDS